MVLHELAHGYHKMFSAENLAKVRAAMPHSCRAVAQISNLLYRRIPFGRPPDDSKAHEFSEARGLKIRDTAGWKPALRAFSPGKTEALLRACYENAKE